MCEIVCDLAQNENKNISEVSDSTLVGPLKKIGDICLTFTGFKSKVIALVYGS